MEQPPVSPITNLESLMATFATGQSAVEKPAPAITEPATPPPATDPAPAAPAAPQSTDPVAAPPAQTEEPPVDIEGLFGQGKQNAAFANMRIQNKKYETTLQKFGEALGIQTSDPDVLIEALTQQLNEHKAAQTGIPLEMLQQFEKLQQDAQQRELQTAATEATRGFQRVKDTYNLSEKELSEFASQLRDAGKNPYTTPMDLLIEYRTLNFDKILEKARTDALAAANTRQEHGQQHSSQPSSAAPAASPGSAKSVKTVSELDSVLRGFNS